MSCLNTALKQLLERKSTLSQLKTRTQHFSCKSGPGFLFSQLSCLRPADPCYTNTQTRLLSQETMSLFKTSVVKGIFFPESIVHTRLNILSNIFFLPYNFCKMNKTNKANTAEVMIVCSATSHNGMIFEF